MQQVTRLTSQEIAERNETENENESLRHTVFIQGHDFTRKRASCANERIESRYVLTKMLSPDVLFSFSS